MNTKPTIEEQIAMCEAEAKTYWRTSAARAAKTHEAAAESLRNYKELVEAVDAFINGPMGEDATIIPYQNLEKLLSKIKQSAQ